MPALDERTIQESTMRAGKPGLQPNGGYNNHATPGTSPDCTKDSRVLELENRYKVGAKIQPSALSRLNDPSRVSPVENGVLTAETFAIPSLEEDSEDLTPKKSVETSEIEKDAITPITVIGARAIEGSRMGPNDASKLRREYGI